MPVGLARREGDGAGAGTAPMWGCRTGSGRPGKARLGWRWSWPRWWQLVGTGTMARRWGSTDLREGGHSGDGLSRARWPAMGSMAAASSTAYRGSLLVAQLRIRDGNMVVAVLERR
ncbi:formin-like protein 6 [Iris pallida]|uniref:Formin-like protein 6 n=1 Tax=Iris pallida TaxID=29817 RepID=A0AAX6E1X4_IRIPA|nr:formin-like protein 6 [Iris pallida]KAJ6822527.1 formin-like protein 6 [Iris pallida]